MKKLILIPIIFISLFLSAQVINTGSITRPVGSSPLLTASIASLSGFSTTAGTVSASQNFTISGTNLTASAIVTAPANYEVSLDNSSFAASKTVSQSGGSLVSQPVTIYVRIASTASAGSAPGNVSIASTGATTITVGVSGTVTSTSPSVSANVNSLSAFTNNAGTASASQNFAVTGSNLTANIIVTPPSGFEVSLDNSSFSTTKTITQSGGSASSTVYARVASSTTAGPYSGNIALSSTGASTFNVAVNATVSSVSTTISQWNFSKTASVVSGWNNMFGDPNTGLSSTDGTTGWQLQSNVGEWYQYGGFYYASNTDGGSSATTPTYGTDFPATVVTGLFLNDCSSTSCYYSSSDVTYPFVINNLPAGTYQIKIASGFKSGVNNTADNGNAEFHIKFGTGADQSSTTVAQKDNTSATTGTQIIFTGTITAGQVIRFGPYRNLAVGGFTCINGLIVTKTN